MLQLVERDGILSVFVFHLDVTALFMLLAHESGFMLFL
jgi:hypothetical protein